jgi:3-phytase
VTNDYYVFTSRRQTGDIAQFKLIDKGNGQIGAELVREFTIPSPTAAGRSPQTEGMVVDQETGSLYIAQEDVGIWKFQAEPDGGTTGKLIDRVRFEGGSHLTDDAEGLTIYYGKNGTGYLLASSQGDSTFVAYTREGNNEYVGNFAIGNNGSIDSVQGVASFPAWRLGTDSEWAATSSQERGGGASGNGFPASRLGTSQSKGCILT